MKWWVLAVLCLVVQLGTLSDSSRTASTPGFQLTDVLDSLLDGTSAWRSEDGDDPLRSLSFSSKVTPLVSHLVHQQLRFFYSPLVDLINAVNDFYTKLLPLDIFDDEPPAQRSIATSAKSVERDERDQSPCGYGVEMGVEYRSCVCPLDWVGSRCERRRELTCQPVLVDPQPQCADADSANVFYGDPVCFQYRRQADAPTFRYRLDCYFVNETGLNASSLHPPFPYPYWTSFTSSRNTSFAITQSPNVTDDWQLLVKIFNFKRLSDLAASQIVPLTPDQVAGRQPLVFTLPLANYSAKYLTGGRLYFEVGVYSLRTGIPPAMTSATRRVDARFLDFSDYRGTGTASYHASLPGWQVVFIVIAVLIAVAIAYRLGRFIYKRRIAANKAIDKKYR